MIADRINDIKETRDVRYFAPEILRSADPISDLNFKTDSWSFGIICVELLAADREQPFAQFDGLCLFLFLCLCLFLFLCLCFNSFFSFQLKK